MPSWLDKRLLPVLALLVGAIAVVPFALRPASDETAAVAPPSRPAGPDAAALKATPVVAPAQAQDREGRRKVVGKRKDPFKPSNQPQKAKTTPAATAALKSAAASAPSAVAATRSPSGGAAPSSGSVTNGNGSTTGFDDPGPAPTSTPQPRPQPADVGPAQYAIAVRVKGDGRERLLRDVTRLSALPDDKHPLLVYLGLLEDRKTAVFLVPSVVEVVSDGACQPSQTACERVHLRRGETMYFEHTAGGRQLQYELELRGVHRRRQGTRPTASSAAASARSRKFARWLVSLQEERLGGIRWEAARGYLVYPAN